jgi:BirA family transcriptional regulator, biotin operon repressor / biotin---[acetyl-CoA-carboxylase] ligase
MVNTKAHILHLLRSGTLVSGEDLAASAGVSRVAVWKHIRSLQEEGFVITAMPRGYCLEGPDDILTQSAVALPLQTVVDEVCSSTMEPARLAAAAGHEAVFISRSQNAGRGRYNREWSSPDGGLYLTYTTPIRLDLAACGLLPLAAASIAADTITELTGVDTALKWPNDIIATGKKLGGVLCEARTDFSAVHSVSVGVGVNANAKVRLPDAVSAQELTGRSVRRSELAEQITLRLQRLLRAGDIAGEQARIRSRMMTLGRRVRVTATDGTELTGTAADITSEGFLILKQGRKQHIIRSGGLRHLD